MAALVRAFRTSLRSVVQRQSQGNSSPPCNSLPSASTKGSELPGGVESAAEGNVERLAGHAAAVARENPVALAQLTAYLHVIDSVDSLYQKYGVSEQKDRDDSIKRAAKLVGLRLPSAPTGRPEGAGSGGS
ncbi:uncharacterized protein EMH_0070620 [Eimeria mitis]|uniref:Uncharacterized protein n=1 Tax=Eimeria mitis TaxID=44415 RepID=U6K2E3_9EIME|nr:uncharacterized protein EMH_0070620 [Eimeria mitis]CDJ31885.1 hypothetical protein EMH_0070620 [Eimeria mitis]